MTIKDNADKKGASGSLGRLRRRSPPNDVLDEIVSYRDSRGDRILTIIVAAVIVMNVLWIYLEGNTARVIVGTLDFVYASIALMACIAALCLIIGSRWWMKYLFIGSITLNSFTIVGGVDYSMMILMILPVVSSCVYYRNTLTRAMIVNCAALMLIGLIVYNSLSPIMLGMYYGMTMLDKIITLTTTFYIVDLLIYLLICIPCYYATKNGIDDIRRQSDLRKEQIGMEKELSNARGIQQGLLIKDFPCKQYCAISSYMSASKEVGGDFYDCFRIGDDRLAIVMADVSGKGLPAALFMASSMTLIRSNAQAGGDLEKAMEKANRELAASNPMKYFVTVWIGVIDLKNGGLTFVNAGHNPPILLQADDHDTYLRTRPGLVLGAMPGVKYHSQEVVIAPGDALYLYTDGVTEQTNAQGELFGENRLLSFLSFGRFYEDPGAILPAVSARVSAFAANTAQADDRTQLVIRYRGTA